MKTSGDYLDRSAANREYFGDLMRSELKRGMAYGFVAGALVCGVFLILVGVIRHG